MYFGLIHLHLHHPGFKRSSQLMTCVMCSLTSLFFRSSLFSSTLRPLLFKPSLLVSSSTSINHPLHPSLPPFLLCPLSISLLLHLLSALHILLLLLFFLRSLHHFVTLSSLLFCPLLCLFSSLFLLSLSVLPLSLFPTSSFCHFRLLPAFIFPPPASSFLLDLVSSLF